MILIEVCETIVEEYWGFHGIWNTEIECALCREDWVKAIMEGNVDLLLRPRGGFGLEGIRRVLVEGKMDKIRWHKRCRWVVWSIGEAFRVV